MGLLDNVSHNEYYAQSNSFGNYQFTSLSNIIDQFMIAYVGENKIIPKISRSDVAFHAQRAMQELSFDTFKSIKSQQIDLPPSLVMPLPHDYVNYTKLSTVDGNGIKHPLYPTKHTSNPFEVKQESDGSYFFGNEIEYLQNRNFDHNLPTGGWFSSTAGKSGAWDSFRETAAGKFHANYILDELLVSNGELTFKHLWQNGWGTTSSRAYGVWQKLNVQNLDTINIKATASSGAQVLSGATILCNYGVVRVGLTSQDPNIGFVNPAGNLKSAYATAPGGAQESPNNNADNFDIDYMEWDDGSTSEKEIEDVDVSNFNDVWVYIQSFSPWTADAITVPDPTNTWDHDNNPTTPEVTVPLGGATVQPLPLTAVNVTHQENSVDSISVWTEGQNQSLTENSTDGNSSTWNNYKSMTPSENKNDDYEDDTYWPNEGMRYGIEPAHAQINGSFFIDDRLGKIHFSSNVSGKAVILDYISDGLGTDAEMQVHKLAEDAMYKWIAHAVISTSSYGQQLVPRFTKEKFAATRKAKLRLSNIKLEEITQILRGKSKQIKH